MTKLLSAGYRRLFRSVFFWIGLAVTCGHHLLGVLNNLHYKSVFVDQVIKADHTLLPDTLITTLVMSVLIALLIGREYGDKTIRNKIITGHSRVTIYLSNLIVCATAAAIYFVVPTLLIGLGLGVPLLGGFELTAKAFILPAIVDLLSVLGLTSLFLLVVMSIQNRTIAAVSVLILAIAMMMWVTAPMREALEAPQYMDEYVFSEEVDDFVSTGKTKENPAYVGGPARVGLEFLYNFLPGGQVEQSSPYNKTADMADLPFWGLAFIAVTTVGGAVIFQKKELK
jgi:ABC-type transport system involved in multi-copper enzyme maturation permease subunit